MTEATTALARLHRTICRWPRVAVALSGGVDSMTLAHVAHRALGKQAKMFHAVSPAVPPRASRRVRDHAAREDWALTILDAGEFSEPQYMANPVNRCFFCKGNLYLAIRDRIRDQADTTLLSGTNLDDLGDYRPGLIAAAEHGVRHPFVEARIAKAGVRALALELGLADLSELPASPCLSSRIETGIRIDAQALAAIDRVEELLRSALRPRTVRCRLRRASIEVELDTGTLLELSSSHRSLLAAEIRSIFLAIGIDSSIDFTGYRRGSAFLTEGMRV